jgi:hypothetical protein
MSRSRRAIVTAAGPNMWSLLTKYALPSFLRYGEAQHYDVVVKELDNDSQTYNGLDSIQARWGKLGALEEALKRYDFVVWMDADIIICRMDDDIELRLAKDDFQAFVLEQFPAEHRVNPNTGVWAMRAVPEATDFLCDVAAAGQQFGPWADQGSIIKVLGWDRGNALYRWCKPGQGSPYLAHTAWLPPGWNQLYIDPEWDREIYDLIPRVARPFALHFAGMTIAEREIAMGAYLGAVQQ